MYYEDILTEIPGTLLDIVSILVYDVDTAPCFLELQFIPQSIVFTLSHRTCRIEKLNSVLFTDEAASWLGFSCLSGMKMIVL